MLTKMFVPGPDVVTRGIEFCEQQNVSAIKNLLYRFQKSSNSFIFFLESQFSRLYKHISTCKLNVVRLEQANDLISL